MTATKIMIKHLPDETATREFAGQLAQIIKSINQGAILFLHGSLGAGKTTFARGFLAGFDYHDKVKSPTYTLVEPYHLSQYDIFHFDFYRLNSADELQQIGIEDYFKEHAICLIEWAEKGLAFLPSCDLDCYIEFRGNERAIRMFAHSEKGEKFLQALPV